MLFPFLFFLKVWMQFFLSTRKKYKTSFAYNSGTLKITLVNMNLVARFKKECKLDDIFLNMFSSK